MLPNSYWNCSLANEMRVHFPIRQPQQFFTSIIIEVREGHSHLAQKQGQHNMVCRWCFHVQKRRVSHLDLPKATCYTSKVKQGKFHILVFERNPSKFQKLFQEDSKRAKTGKNSGAYTRHTPVIATQWAIKP